MREIVLLFILEAHCILEEQKIHWGRSCTNNLLLNVNGLVPSLYSHIWKWKSLNLAHCIYEADSACWGWKNILNPVSNADTIFFVLVNQLVLILSTDIKPNFHFNNEVRTLNFVFLRHMSEWKTVRLKVCPKSCYISTFQRLFFVSFKDVQW